MHDNTSFDNTFMIYQWASYSWTPSIYLFDDMNTASALYMLTALSAGARKSSTVALEFNFVIQK